MSAMSVTAPSTPPTEAPPLDDIAHKRRTRRWWVLVAAAVVVLAAAGACTWWFLLRDDVASETTTAELQVVEVSTGTFGEVVSAEGTVAAAESEDLSFTSAGTVAEVNVAAGDTVTAGQVLATINSAELEAALAEVEADLADAEATLDEAESSGASDEQIAASEAAVITAGDAVAAAEEDLAGASLVASINGLVTTVDLTAGEQLGGSGSGGTTVTGSGSGSGMSSTQLGSSSSGGSPGGGSGTTGGSATDTASEAQIQIVSQGRFEVELGVDNADIDSLEVGQEVDLGISTSGSGSGSGLPGFPGGGGFQGGGGVPGASDDTDGDTATVDVTATGTVIEVGRVADASSGVATYPVVVAFTDDTGEVWVGATATAEINVSARTDVVQVPSDAVTTEDGRSTVTVAVDGTADGRTEAREVTTGERAGTMIEIVDGVSVGELVLVESNDSAFGGPGGDAFPGGEPPEGFEMRGASGGGSAPDAGAATAGGGDGS